MINFPDTPTLNQVFTAGTKTWKWDGTKWVGVIPAGSGGTASSGTDLTDVWVYSGI